MKWRFYRPPDPLPDRGAANALLLCVAAVLMMHAPRQPSAVNLGAALLTAWSWYIVHRGWRAPGAWLRAGLVGAAVFLTAREYGTILGRDTGVSFLLLLLASKLTELKRARDYRIAVFLVYFATLSEFLFSQGPGTATTALLLGLATTWTLHRLNHPGAALGMQGVRTALGVVLFALPLMLVLYLFFPRIAGGLIALPSLETASRLGLSDRVAPGSVQQLLGNDAPALRAFFDGAPPPTGELYWRALVLTESDGRSWRAGIRRGEAPAALIAEGPPLRYRLHLEPSSLRAVPVLGRPAAAPAGTAIEEGGVLRAQSELRETRRFTLDALLRFRDIGAPEVRRSPRLNPRVRALVEQLRENAGDAASLSAAVLRYFREQPFRYTLAPPALPDDWLAAFLFETRAGYCEHYASAYATLMRAAGVPSRVITGYQGGDWNASGGFLLVRQSDAHAWAEIHLPDRGWLRVDPTAAIAPERIEHGIEALRALEARGSAFGTLAPEVVRRLIGRPWWRALWRGAQQRYDAFLVSWTEWVSGYDAERQLRLLQDLGFREPSWRQGVGLLVAGAALALTLIAVVLFRARERTDAALRSWERLCRRLARAGVSRNPQEGPLDFGRRAGVMLPALRGELAEIAGLYAAARYGRTSKELNRQLARRVRRLRINRRIRPASA